MAANTDPIFTRTADVQIGGAVIGPTANTAQDGTSSSTSMYALFQADATEGGYVQRVTVKAVGSPAATVMRLYLSTITGSLTMGTTNTVANTSLIGEMTLPAITLSQTAATPQFEWPINMAFPPGYRLLASFGTSTGAAGTGYICNVIAGKY
jgi:hypothetical protein